MLFLPSAGQGLPLGLCSFLPSKYLLKYDHRLPPHTQELGRQPEGTLLWPDPFEGQQAFLWLPRTTNVAASSTIFMNFTWEQTNVAPYT